MKSTDPFTSVSQRRRSRAILWSLAIAGFGLGPTSLSIADAVKISKLWIDNITIEKVADGNLVYTTKGGEEVEKPLANVEGIKLDAFKDLATAYAAIEAKKPAEAIPLFQKVASTASKPWIKQFCKAQLITLYDQAKMPVESVNMVLELAKETNEKTYFSNPTDKSLAALEPKMKRDIRDRLTQAQPSLKGAPADAVKAILVSLGPVEAAPTVATPTTPANSGGTTGSTVSTPATPTTPTAPTVASGPSAIPLPVEMDEKDPITIMLKKGDFAGALKATDDLLSKPSNEMGLRLYQNGLAKLYIALANKDSKAAHKEFLDAGLSFARCVYHFPRGSWCGPAQIELGYVHLKIGKPEIAKSLFDKATIKIDSEKDVALKAHLDELTSSPASSTE